MKRESIKKIIIIVFVFASVAGILGGLFLVGWPTSVDGKKFHSIQDRNFHNELLLLDLRVSLSNDGSLSSEQRRDSIARFQSRITENQKD